MIIFPETKKRDRVRVRERERERKRENVAVFCRRRRRVNPGWRSVYAPGFLHGDRGLSSSLRETKRRFERNIAPPGGGDTRENARGLHHRSSDGEPVSSGEFQRRWSGTFQRQPSTRLHFAAFAATAFFWANEFHKFGDGR